MRIRSNENRKVGEVVASKMMDRKDDREEYERRICESFSEATTIVRGRTSRNMISLFKDVLTAVVTQVVDRVQKV